MIAQERLQWQWRSQRGALRSENRDACGIFGGCNYTFAVVMDASCKGIYGARFNFIWISEVLKRLTDEMPAPDSIVSAMREAQYRLREEHLLSERACYAALLLPHASQTAFAFVCGDCCIGNYSSAGTPQWLTETHTLADACNRASSEHMQSRRHIVTRTLNAKRFESPQITELPVSDSATWVLATDGFWVSQPSPSVPPEDDCSRLLLGTTIERLHDADAPNLILSGEYTDHGVA